MSKEKVRVSAEKYSGNKPGATLFVGCGGIGSDIVKRVSEEARAKGDDLAKVRFVAFDTDVNDLSRADSDVNVIGIQTSSPRKVREYLQQDIDAQTEWFPNNMIINDKTVTEGAGQVRAISRLALNATIKNGQINKLYRAIDELYYKDGSDKQQAIKINIVSTAAGGTGSGIAMIVGLLIRQYLEVNYQGSSALIRGYILLPGIMDSFGPSTSEKLSLRRNGYATIKEINAFMMRPFFDSVPELARYKDLCVEVPNAAGGKDKLKGTPFDFCFLYDRVDSKVATATSLGQYKAFIARSIYEQNIGPMSGKASSKEDNIHKEFLNEEKLNRNRFASSGAYVIRYPYGQIREYLAYDWIQKQLIGYSDAEVDEDTQKALIANSWLVYDKRFQEKVDAYRKDPVRGEDEPKIEKVFIDLLETGSDEYSKKFQKQIDSMQETYAQFTRVLGQDKKENGQDKKENGEETHGTIEVPPQEGMEVYAVNRFLHSLIAECKARYEKPRVAAKNYKEKKGRGNIESGFTQCYNSFDAYQREVIIPNSIKEFVKSVVEGIFTNSVMMRADKTEEYMPEALLCYGGKALHPNLMRYLLYKLQSMVGARGPEPSENAFKEECKKRTEGEDESDKEKFNVPGVTVSGQRKEEDLRRMCKACDKKGASEDSKKRCGKFLGEYRDLLDKKYTEFFCYYVCQEVEKYLPRLIGEFEHFYSTFEDKLTSLSKRKESVLSQIKFANGDVEYCLFSDPKLLMKLVETSDYPASADQEESDLYEGIYNAVKKNVKINQHIAYSVFTDERPADIFEAVVVEKFKGLVDKVQGERLDVDILSAVALEYEMSKKAPEGGGESTREDEITAKNAYLAEIIQRGKDSAAFCLVRKTFEEGRPIESMAYSQKLQPRNGIEMPETLFDPSYASLGVKSNELIFYSAMYDITPDHVYTMASPQSDPGKQTEVSDIDDEVTPGMVGDYFLQYQDYMRKIGPDNRLNPVITPHIDKRWNSISVMPEIDPQGYQRVLMKRIHKAMIYGFLYRIINKRVVSSADKKKKIYEYKDRKRGIKKLIVSNHTKCDRLFEVLDALYFDRYAVHSIHAVADARREKELQASTIYPETTFYHAVRALDRKAFIDSIDMEGEIEKRIKPPKKVGETALSAKMSLFEIPLLYWSSLPKRDAAELEIMFDAIVEILEKEISTFMDSDDVSPTLAGYLVEHYDTLYDNYTAFPKLYGGHAKGEVKDSLPMMIIRGKVMEKLEELDVSRESFRLKDYSEEDDLLAGI